MISEEGLTLVYLKLHCIQYASVFTFSMDNNGSSKSSFPISSWADYGRDWKDTTRTVEFLDPSALSSPIPVAAEVFSTAVDGVSLGASGFDSFDVPDMLASWQKAGRFSINPITSDSGADRVVASGSLCTQLQKSWTWLFSCSGRYWILYEQY